MADELKKTASSAATAAPLEAAPPKPISSPSPASAAAGGDVEEALREWDGGICNCCGSPCTCCPGWGIWGLVFCSFSSCLFGLNQKRAFGASSSRAIAWALLFFTLSSLFGLIAFGVDYVSKLRCLSSRSGAAERAEAATNGAADAESFARSVEFCAGQYSTAWQALTIVSAVAGAAAIGLGAWRRMQMRERFSIRGSAVSDFCLWLWCSPCALCQETRTLELRGVRDGVWHGSDPLAAARKKKKEAAAAATATTPPSVQTMPSKVV